MGRLYLLWSGVRAWVALNPVNPVYTGIDLSGRVENHCNKRYCLKCRRRFLSFFVYGLKLLRDVFEAKEVNGSMDKLLYVHSS